MLLGLPDNHNLVMASVEPIDISSSDSDSDSDLREIDNYRDESPVREVTSSVNSRILPAWASGSTMNSISGSNGTAARKDTSSSSSRQIFSNGISSTPRNNFTNGGSMPPPSSQMGVHTSRDTNSSQHMRRTLPPSLQPSSSRVKPPHHTSQSNNVAHNIGGSSYINGQQKFGSGSRPNSSNGNSLTGGSSYVNGQKFVSGSSSSYSNGNNITGGSSYANGQKSASGPWSNSSNGNNFTKENNMRGNVNDPSSFERRMLPQSMQQGRYPPTPFPAANSGLNMGVGEESPAGADERYVLQAAVQDLHQPKVETDLPNNLLSVSLLRHQKIALAWMLTKESSGLCLGGILADDQGLGKTISTTALILMQRHLEEKSKRKESSSSRAEALNLDDDDNGNDVITLDHPKEVADLTKFAEAKNPISGFQSKKPRGGTLIVCPASVVRQWARELDEKVSDDARLSVLIYHGGNRTKDPSILASYDAVLTTYAIVANEVPKQPLVDDDDDERNGEMYGLSSSFSLEKKRKKSQSKKKSKKRKGEIDDLDSAGGAMAKVMWSRVVLDEAQTIKNHRTQMARACCSLRAKRRWCLSGTPIQNSIEELFSYFRFLRYDPYDKYKTFMHSIKHLISRDSVNGYKKLQVVLRNIMLRRTKGTLLDGKPIINLPPKKVDLAKVSFSKEERAFYNQLEADSRKQFKAYAAAGTVNQNYANILLLLLRLRQACDHPLLVKGMGSDPVGKISSDMAKSLPTDLLVNLLKQLEASLAICLVCRDPPENAVVTMCGHVFCYQCVSDNLTGEDNTCPASGCKEQLGADVVFSRSTLRRCISDDIEGDSSTSNEVFDKSIVLRSEYVSSKVNAALEILKSNCAVKKWSKELFDLDEDECSSSGHPSSSGRGEAEKAIVFSQWTGMLDLLEISLKNSCLSYRRLDGTMSIAARDKAVKDFNTDPKVDVMIMSLKAGNLGLNMVAASRVILLDLWWNPTTEDQAVDRAHRIGQTRPVTVSRLTITETVEDRILALQEEKRKMVASAFGEDPSGVQSSRLTVDDLRFLFEGR